MKSKWIEHKGKRIFYADFANFGYDVDALEAEMKEVDALLCTLPKNSVLTITDVRGTVASKEAVQLFKASAAETQPYELKAAVVGVTGYRKVLLDAVSLFSGQSFGAFNDLEEAKDWVVEAN